MERISLKSVFVSRTPSLYASWHCWAIRTLACPTAASQEISILDTEAASSTSTCLTRASASLTRLLSAAISSFLALSFSLSSLVSSAE